MFDTTFGFNSDFNQYELKIDHSKFDVTVAWLRKFQVRFNLTSFSRYILIEVLQASHQVIDTLIAKFPPVSVDERLEFLRTLPDDDLTVVLHKFVSPFIYDLACMEWADLNAVWELVKDELPSLEVMVNYLDFDNYVKYEASDYEKFGYFESFFKLHFITPFSDFTAIAEVKAEYRRLAKTMHPDAGGDAESFALLNSQYNDALDALRELAIA